MARTTAPNSSSAPDAGSTTSVTGASLASLKRGPPHFGYAFDFMRWVGTTSIHRFFDRIQVVGGEDVPAKGPLIIVASHPATIVDTMIITTYMPHRRKMHFWAKRGLFKHPIASWLLHNSGNLPVDRKTRNNQKLFASTFLALRKSHAICLFPEGGSFTEPHLHSIKAGAAWAALEYARYLAIHNARHPEVTKVQVVPIGISYTDKSRLGSSAVIQFGRSFSIDAYTKDFLRAQDATDPIARETVKALTDRIENDLRSLTINAPDWETFHAARMARELLWPKKKSLPLEQFLNASNAILELVSDDRYPAQEEYLRKRASKARAALCRLQCLCIAANTDLWTLNDFAAGLSKRRRPTDSVPTPHGPLRALTRQSISLSWHSLYLLPLLALHAPVLLLTGYLQATKASHEEESMASAKTLVAWTLTLFLYLALSFLVAVPFLLTPPGWVLAVVGLFVINQALRLTMLGAYERVKRWTGYARLLAASIAEPLEGFALTDSSPSVRLAVEKVSVGPAVQDTINKALARKGERRGLASWRRPMRARFVGVLLRTRAEARQALQLLLDALEDRAHGGDGNGVSAVSTSASEAGGETETEAAVAAVAGAERVTDDFSGKSFRVGGLASQLDAVDQIRSLGGRLRLEYGKQYASQWS
ncbi:unnamed protein product [Tilletia controversa]|uniref:Phospholipid/glycerol acyltransferase domain-containing protein n=3 Tax=Tilletia TaxID=13289 RepID=A0A8X7N0Z2_9BASI|nr:hypothetical protein CF336_g1602 [Tilletia laevis]KAE8206210.1 hypothetical protein CF328_g54 [Tilletia controversa]KAE8263949.1 hypothetical protein A4X03_0g1308 [Tilletia caries]KAE8207753.1 hypothetical protein CF335_g913 [Tilletia laevis]KAE8256192.1 hypothetical protein A4X06_0g24 [Tilletia controversa]